MTREQTLIRMANQIGTFFESMPDQAQAQAGIAKHIKNFWDPRMRKAIFALLDAHASEALKPMVRAALVQHRSMLD